MQTTKLPDKSITVSGYLQLCYLKFVSCTDHVPQKLVEWPLCAAKVPKEPNYAGCTFLGEVVEKYACNDKLWKKFSGAGFRSGCRNVSQHQQQSFSGLNYKPGRSLRPQHGKNFASTICQSLLQGMGGGGGGRYNRSNMFDSVYISWRVCYSG